MIKKSKVYHIGIWGMTLIFSIIVLFPVYWIFLSAITPKDMLFTRPINYIPIAPTLENYRTLFASVDVLGQASNTLTMAFFTIILTLLFSVLAAYAFARYVFPGKTITYLYLIFSAMLPVIVTIIPLFQLFRSMNLTNTVTGLIIINTSTFIPFTMMTLTNFIQTIPVSIEDAADVDGAGVLTKIFVVLLPLLKPALATMAIIIFVWCMNEFMVALVFTTNINSMPLSVGITMIPRIDQFNIPWEMISALATLMLLPIILFVMVFERNIMDGLITGSIKE